MSDWTFEQAAGEVKVAHRLGYWWGTANDPADPITPDEIAEADAYLDRWLAEHDAALIEGLAGKLSHPSEAPYEVWASGAGDWLREKARRRREESDRD